MAQELTGYEVLLGVTGGIAAYKSAQLCSLLVKNGCGVTTALTEHACRFIGPLTFSTLSSRPAYTSLFEAEDVYRTEHISLAERADLIVIAPVTANMLAKIAGGICDDLLSTVLCAADSPVLLAPAMNHRMWEHPATQRNLKTLQEWGLRFVGPETGRLACGDEAIGRMSEPEAIYAAAREILTASPSKSSR